MPREKISFRILSSAVGRKANESTDDSYRAYVRRVWRALRLRTYCDNRKRRTRDKEGGSELLISDVIAKPKCRLTQASFARDQMSAAESRDSSENPNLDRAVRSILIDAVSHDL